MRDGFTEHGTVVARRTKVNAGEDARILHCLQRAREAAVRLCHPDQDIGAQSKRGPLAELADEWAPSGSSAR